MAKIYTMVGEQDAAIDELEYLLSIEGGYTAHSLNLDPEFDPLREHPRFQSLLERHGLVQRGS
ncbi:MAG: hypothetical protein OEV49_04765 [candidate division Zixibacteria bacterium]|nr:hypothetical protein [candidate division Zixibacteria bacterium]MDH3938474.1 hypothetical protein [candidate division Zixibacteria bacterium]MDH4032420.1 hypothetical protein [candidate division Zixibacteria bacterium]